MLIRPMLALFAATILFACAAPETNQDIHKIGWRNAKLYAKEQLKLDVDDELFVIEGDTDNNFWSRYWNDVREFDDPEPRKWQDQIHTLYAFYFQEADAGPGEAIWIFVKRTDGTFVGTMKTGRGHRQRFGEGGGAGS